MTTTEPATAWPRRAPSALFRLLRCIRLDEVCVLQGAPVIGALFSIRDFSPASLFGLALLVAGNVCLVGHVFVLNDWAGIDTDARDPTRAARTFRARRVTGAGMGFLAAALLLAGLALLGAVSMGACAIGVLIAVLSAVYSAPPVGGKGIPLLSSVLHLLGGALHFLLGYAAFSAVSWQAAAISGFFGLVFAAGHLTHEARDHDGDRLNGIRTNAVAFGRRPAFRASVAMFGTAYLLLAALALSGLVPHVLAFAAALAFPLHLLAALRASRAGLTFDGLRRLQVSYRRLHAAIGIMMLATVPPW